MNFLNKKYILFTSVCLIWGTTWLAMSFAIDSIPPVTATGLRFLLTSPLIIFLARRQNIPLLFPDGRRHLMWVVAIFYFALPFWLMIQGEVYISSGLASVIFAIMPAAVMLSSSLLLKEKFVTAQYLGLLLAIFCLCLILGIETSMEGSHYLLGIAALSLAVVLHAVMYVVARKQLLGIHVLTYSALPSGMSSILLLATGFVLEQPDIAQFSTHSLLAVAYLGLVAGFGGIVAYFKLNELATPFQASICFLVFPLMALILDGFINRQLLSTPSLLLVIPLLLGILLTKIKPLRSEKN